jgi:hypothetical protein
MPSQERLRPHDKDIPTAARPRLTQCCEQQPVVKLKPWLADPAAEDRQLVAKHENLELLRPLAPREEHEQFQ